LKFAVGFSSHNSTCPNKLKWIKLSVVFSENEALEQILALNTNCLLSLHYTLLFFSSCNLCR